MAASYPTPHPEFWSNVDIRGRSECWPWIGRNTRGYGSYFERQSKRRIRAHRFALEVTSGLPEGMHALHRCDVKACCNPRHLYAGTQADNMRDFYARGGRKNPSVADRHYAAKMSSAVVTEARRRHAEGASILSLARENGVCWKTMRYAILGRNWKTIPMP